MADSLVIPGIAYVARTRLRNWRGLENDPSHGTIGVMYNVQDVDNFDFIVYR